MCRGIVAVIALFLTACGTMKQETRIDALLRPYEGVNAPGASVVVVRDGFVLYRKGFGRQNVEQHLPATPGTHYRLASVTKQFTAAAVLILAHRGRLDVSDSIRKYLPSLPSYAEPITIQQLLTHTSGLIDYEDLIPAGTTRQLTDFDVLLLLSKQTSTYFTPGTAYRYSNSGYALLALIVAKASRHSFPDFLKSEIFDPLGMSTTVAYEPGISRISNRAYGYSRAEGPAEGGAPAATSWIRTDQSLTSAVLGDGGIYTSVDELVAWVKSLDAGFSLDATLPRVATDKPGLQYGYGWRISEHDGQRIVWHTGESIGFRNALVRFPDQKLSVVVLTNRNEGEPFDVALAIADVVRQR